MADSLPLSLKVFSRSSNVGEDKVGAEKKREKSLVRTKHLNECNRRGAGKSSVEICEGGEGVKGRFVKS